MGRVLFRRNREGIWLHIYTCFAWSAVSHHSQLNAMGRLLQMISYFLSSLQHLSLAPAHIPFCSQELQGWPVSSSDRWWISPCAGSVSWANVPFGRKIAGSAVLLMPVFAPELQPSLAVSRTQHMKHLVILWLESVGLRINQLFPAPAKLS